MIVVEVLYVKPAFENVVSQRTGKIGELHVALINVHQGVLDEPEPSRPIRAWNGASRPRDSSRGKVWVVGIAANRSSRGRKVIELREPVPACGSTAIPNHLEPTCPHVLVSHLPRPIAAI